MSYLPDNKVTNEKQQDDDQHNYEHADERHCIDQKSCKYSHTHILGLRRPTVFRYEDYISK